MRVYKRGRNSNPHAHPRGATRQEYQIATGLETLFGWLYLQGETQRLNQLFDRLLQGEFMPTIKEQFLSMLEYFGQSPIIVRSSSLLEDGIGNAFAGKYESVFCPNQGTLEERYRV